MRNYLATALLITCGTALLVAQTPAKQDEKAPKPANKALTLVGCVADEEGNAGQLTFLDEKTGTVYRLSGVDAREYVGRRVQIAEVVDSKRIKVRGGLVPSPNAAAQAGAIDPTQSAMAGQGSTTRGVGTGELPEFRVKSVKPMKGTCPQK